MFRSNCLSDVDVKLSQVNVLMSEINQIISQCPVPVQSRTLLPRVDQILSEITLIVAFTQADCSNDLDDEEVSLVWDNYNNTIYYDLHNYDSNNNDLSFSMLSGDGGDYHDNVGGDVYEDVGVEGHGDVGDLDHGDVGDDNRDDDGGDEVEMTCDSSDGEDDNEYSIAHRVLTRRRSSQDPDEILHQHQPNKSPPPADAQVDLFILKSLTCILRNAPGDVFSAKKSARRRKRRLMKNIHPELRNVFKFSPELFSPVPMASVPDVRPPVPLVDWTRVNQKGLGNLPQPQMFPKHGCSEDKYLCPADS